MAQNRLTPPPSGRPLLSRRTALGGLALPLALATGGRGAGALPAGGVLRIDRDRVMADDLVLGPGASVFVAAGATLTLTGDLVAPASRIFTGPGRVDLTRSRVVAARPEWWGAVPDDPQVDCIPALDACLAAHLSMQLGPGDYHIRSPWIVNRDNRRIWGIGRTKDARGTRLLRHGASGAVVLVGSEAAPPAINDFARGIDMRWIVLGRDRVAAATAPDDPDAAVGLRIRHVLDARFEGLRSQEHAIGFSIHGAVHSFAQDCSAFRSTTSDTPANDGFIAFDLGGPIASGATGSNASLYLVDCNASLGVSRPLGSAIGIRMTAGLADTYIVRFETASIARGIVIDGQASALGEDRVRVAHVDVRIEAPVLDQCTEAGITLSDLSASALVDIRSPYVALGPGGTAALAFDRCGGDVDVSGGQLLGGSALGAGGRPVGLRADACSGLSVSGLKLLDFAEPVKATGLSAFTLDLSVNGRMRAVPAPAVALRDCRAGEVRARITGVPGAFAAGVAATGRSERITVDAAAIDSDAIAAGALVTADGAPVPPLRPGPVLVVSPFQSGAPGVAARP